VNLEGGSVELDNYDINGRFGAMVANVQSLRVLVTDGTLNIVFAPSKNRPLVAALEILNPNDPPLPDSGLVARLNAAGSALVADGRSWAADQYYDASMTLAANIPITGTLDDVIYQTYRKVLTDTLTMQYAIPVPAADTYEVRLHFAEPYWGVPGRFTSSDCTPAACPNRRKFDVVVEGTTVLDNYDLNAETAPATAIVKTYRVPVSDGTLDLFFDSRASSGGVDRAIVSGIEVSRVGATPDTTAPTAPANLRVVDETANSVLLAWDAASDASGTVIYEVYNNRVLVATTTSTSALINTDPRAQQTFAVRVRDIFQNAAISLPTAYPAFIMYLLNNPGEHGSKVQSTAIGNAEHFSTR
jgi:hypothetical protein